MCKKKTDGPITSIDSLPLLLTVAQAEATGAASGRKIRQMCADGELKATKIGSDWRIGRDAFLRHFGLIDM